MERNVMAKVGRFMPCYQQLCYAHGIQLAIIDVLYKTSGTKVTRRNTNTV